METIYERIRRLRQENNMSQDELAKKTGYTSRSTINKIEAGKIDISSFLPTPLELPRHT